ncbi:MAG: TonB-dependent receptor plug domain-containing protein, partial [Ginsengibacter sp.]
MDFKVHYYYWPSMPKVSKQTLKIMKLIAIILFAACLQVSAKGYSQISLSETNTPLQKVFQEIGHQSGYDFVSTYETLREAGNVTVNVQNVSLQKALEECLKGKPLIYLIIGKTVVIQLNKKYYNTSSYTIALEPFPPPIQIHGRIINKKGEPLPNVSVLIVGTQTGTTTNSDGRFALTVPDENVVLEISSVGYKTEKVNVGKETEINVVLELEVSDLSNVVVVGYGSQKKSDLTGAISSVKGDDLTQLSTQRVDQALQGRASGVMVLNTDGAPGGKTTIRVRGMNSVLGGNNALVVVDGLQGGDLSTLNPNDIASIEILKDASATAIYGAQGANGVILVTTKLGKIGKPVISYDFFYGKQKIEKTLPTMSAADFARTVNAYKQTQNSNGTTPPPLFSDGQIAKFEAKGFGTNWQDLIYRNAPLQNHDLSISGG